MADVACIMFSMTDHDTGIKTEYNIPIAHITNFHAEYKDSMDKDGKLIICVGLNKGNVLYHKDNIYVIDEPKQAKEVYGKLQVLLPNK